MKDARGPGGSSGLLSGSAILQGPSSQPSAVTLRLPRGHAPRPWLRNSLQGHTEGGSLGHSIHTGVLTLDNSLPAACQAGSGAGT